MKLGYWYNTTLIYPIQSILDGKTSVYHQHFLIARPPHPVIAPEQCAGSHHLDSLKYKRNILNGTIRISNARGDSIVPGDKKNHIRNCWLPISVQFRPASASFSHFFFFISEKNSIIIKKDRCICVLGRVEDGHKGWEWAPTCPYRFPAICTSGVTGQLMHESVGIDNNSDVRGSLWFPLWFSISILLRSRVLFIHFIGCGGPVDIDWNELSDGDDDHQSSSV